jgi:AcrR family transcriptional regulator
MARFTHAQKDARRQEILGAALRCFSRQGFHNTTTGDIVRESGVSQGTLYLYFGSKDDIILALADDRRQGEALVDAMAQSEQDPIAGLFLLIDLHGRSLIDAQRTDARRVGVQGWAEALSNPTIRERIEANRLAVQAGIVRLVERGQQTGQIKADVDPDAVARTLVAVFQGLTLQAAWGEDLDLGPVGRLVREMIRNVLFTPAALAANP